jgi:hypothetical protein
MPRYEIIVHVTRDLPCASAEEAAAIVRHEGLAESGAVGHLLHLAVWREDPAPAASPLPLPVRQTLRDVFTALERCAAEAETTFRDRVAAILIGPRPTAPRGDERDPAEGPPRVGQPEAAVRERVGAS